MSITRHRCPWATTPEDIHGKIVVWGDVMESPAIRVLVIDTSDHGVQASEANQTLHIPPLPRELGEGWKGSGSSGIEFDWECPSAFPGDGQEFTIASFRQSFTKHRGEHADFESAVIRHSTLRLKGRCLPLVAPEPAPEEQQAVGILRKTGASVFLDGFQGDHYEGRPKGSVKRVCWSCEHTGGQQLQVTDAGLLLLQGHCPKREARKRNCWQQRTSMYPGNCHLRRYGAFTKRLLEEEW